MNLNQITVPALDVAEAIIFYKTLGLKLIVESLPTTLDLYVLMAILRFQFIKRAIA